MRQVERALQREIVTRLRAAPLDAIVIGSPNGVFFPARTPAERELVRRIVHQLKATGQLTPGAPDLVVLWRDGCGGIELKRPAEKTLLGSQPKGYSSAAQIEFAATCRVLGIRYAICASWPEVRDTLIAWGRLPASWRDAEQRIGRRAA